MCLLYCLVHLVSFSSPHGMAVSPWWMIPQGQSHRGHTATHIDEVSSHCDIAFIHTVSISCGKKKQDRWKCTFCSTSLFFLMPHTRIHTQPHILTYLSSSCTHTRTLKTPHRTRDCSSTILYSYERVSPLSISLIWIQNNLGRIKRDLRNLLHPSLFPHLMSLRRFLWRLIELFYLIKKGDKCKGEPSAVNFKTWLSMIPQNVNRTQISNSLAMHRVIPLLSFYSFLHPSCTLTLVLSGEVVFKWTFPTGSKHFFVPLHEQLRMTSCETFCSHLSVNLIHHTFQR